MSIFEQYYKKNPGRKPVVQQTKQEWNKASKEMHEAGGKVIKPVKRFVQKAGKEIQVKPPKKFRPGIRLL